MLTDSAPAHIYRQIFHIKPDCVHTCVCIYANACVCVTDGCFTVLCVRSDTHWSTTSCMSSNCVHSKRETEATCVGVCCLIFSFSDMIRTNTDQFPLFPNRLTRRRCGCVFFKCDFVFSPLTQKQQPDTAVFSEYVLSTGFVIKAYCWRSCSTWHELFFTHQQRNKHRYISVYDVLSGLIMDHPVASSCWNWWRDIKLLGVILRECGPTLLSTCDSHCSFCVWLRLTFCLFCLLS